LAPPLSIEAFGSHDRGWGRLLGVCDPNAFSWVISALLPRRARLTILFMDPEPCPVCGRFPNRPVTADAVVIRDGRVLLIRRKHDPDAGRYALPGGFVDQQERPEECAVRELREECGIAGAVEGLVGVYAAPNRDPQRHSITFVYRVRPFDGAEPQAGDDADGVVWAPLDDLPPLAFDHAAILADVRADREWGARP
jgi:8-oxo-dGTP diphosphatase